MFFPGDQDEIPSPRNENLEEKQDYRTITMNDIMENSQKTEKKNNGEPFEEQVK